MRHCSSLLLASLFSGFQLVACALGIHPSVTRTGQDFTKCMYGVYAVYHEWLSEFIRCLAALHVQACCYCAPGPFVGHKQGQQVAANNMISTEGNGVATNAKQNTTRDKHEHTT